MANGISGITTQPTGVRPGRIDEETGSSGRTTSPAIAPAQQEKVTLAGERTESLTYADPRARLAQNRPDLAQLLDESERQVGQVMQFLRGVLEQQGLAVGKVAAGEQRLNLDPQTVEAAQQAVAEDGEWGVSKTAERILDFAQYAIGDDPQQLETIRAAVQQGFDEARQMLGGTLPEISEKTYEAVMAEFDRWQQDGLPQKTQNEPRLSQEA
ncbi:hypothetical protein N8I74_17110 [Chitiniphilus purpureus]|uniref:DUF5610 domain-containing protein n=1 Tax=Chitiniphilus purpureus TaxID=2981137 RepID=A0ABY6DND3_9NEIS|nr:hypothetical protein [Chitiniphilus sp. CD1]UXY15011.1 hypothetical protein N8I74_17110 [Chitiniphilus sp. CD1]